MTVAELLEKLNMIQKMKCETQTIELKKAGDGCPKRLYDTLSSFSNQDEGGTIIFGVDEEDDYRECGVYDAQDLQKRVNEQCLQMEPVVRPLLTVAEKSGRHFVSAEIPAVDMAERPCYYRGHGRLKGSYTRIGDRDEPMTEYEVYSYEAFRKKYQDDVREVGRATLSSLIQERVKQYIGKLKSGKPNLAYLSEEEIYELMSIVRNGKATLHAVMLFSPYPQAYFPQLCILAVAVPGLEMGETGLMGERFTDNQRIEGSIPEMLQAAIQFVRKNMKTKVIINSETGEREDRTEYPVAAVREAIINALVHRDYSIHTEGMPIQLLMFEDRMEIHSPGGIYGRIKMDQLGKVQPDTRNPVLAVALETLGITENRYSGIPTIRREMKRMGLAEPEFLNQRGSFIVKFYKGVFQETIAEKKERRMAEKKTEGKAGEKAERMQGLKIVTEGNDLLGFCRTPRTRKEICDYLGLSSVTYAIQAHVMPLVEEGLLRMSMPDKPKSPKQRFYLNPKLAGREVDRWEE